MQTTGLPLIAGLGTVNDIPHTISFFIRKMSQIASFDELPKEKRPPEIYWDNPKDLDAWFDKVFDREKTNTSDSYEFVLDLSEIE